MRRILGQWYDDQHTWVIGLFSALLTAAFLSTGIVPASAGDGGSSHTAAATKLGGGCSGVKVIFILAKTRVADGTVSANLLASQSVLILGATTDSSLFGYAVRLTTDSLSLGMHHKAMLQVRQRIHPPSNTYKRRNWIETMLVNPPPRESRHGGNRAGYDPDRYSLAMDIRNERLA